MFLEDCCPAYIGRIGARFKFRRERLNPGEGRGPVFFLDPCLRRDDSGDRPAAGPGVSCRALPAAPEAAEAEAEAAAAAVAQPRAAEAAAVAAHRPAQRRGPDPS